MKQLFNYEPATGHFIRLTTCGGQCAGGIAGGIKTSKNGLNYWQIRVDRKLYKAHNLAFLFMTGRWAEPEVDHKDGDGLNNKWVNLREATYTDNACNRSMHDSNKLRVKGVYRHGNKYRAQIGYKGKNHHIGLFFTVEAAKIAYEEAAKKLHGEFARTN